MTKSVGPSTLPWGIPLSTGADLDCTPFTLTIWVRLVKKAFTQLRTLPLIPYASLVLHTVEHLREIEIDRVHHLVLYNLVNAFIKVIQKLGNCTSTTYKTKLLGRE